MSPFLKPWLMLGIIFIAGSVTGSALTFALSPHFFHPGQPEGDQSMRVRWMTKLVRNLDLTDQQQTKIQPIIDDAAKKVEALHRDEIERGGQILKTADDQISAILTPEQRVELQRLATERQKKFNERIRQWGPPRDGTGPLRRFGPGGPANHGGPDDRAPADDGTTPPPRPQNSPPKDAPPPDA